MNTVLQLAWYCVAAAFVLLLIGMALAPFWNDQPRRRR